MSEPATRSVPVQLALASSLVLLIVGCRLVIDTPNFQPVMAVALFAGFCFPHRWPGLLAVITGMTVSDALIGFYQWELVAVVYLALASPLLAGYWLRRRASSGLRLGVGVAGFSLATAAVFYLSTNLAVWSLTPWYASDLAGLTSCLVMGLPFFKWTLFSNLLFAGLLFSGLSLTEHIRQTRLPIGPRRRLAPVPVRSFRR